MRCPSQLFIPLAFYILFFFLILWYSLKMKSKLRHLKLCIKFLGESCENNFTFFTIEIDYLHFLHHVAILITYWVLQFVQAAWTVSERSLHLLLLRKLFFPMIWHIIQGNEANWCYLWSSYSSEAEDLSLLWCDTELLGNWLPVSSGTKVYCSSMKMTVTWYF